MVSYRCRAVSILILIIVSAFLFATFFFPSSSSSNTHQINSESTSSRIEQKSVCHQRFAFFGDSNTLGMALLGQNMGWRQLGGYPRFILERQQITCKIPQLNENAVIKTGGNITRNNRVEDPFQSFTSPSHIFALAGASLAGEGDAVKLFTKFQPFELATELFSIRNKNRSKINDKHFNSSSFVPLDVAFLMFGTNDCIKTNSKNTSTKQHIHHSYRKFIVEEIFENFGAGRVVVVTPPRILAFCHPAYCTRHDRNQLDVDIVGMLRKLVSELKSVTHLSSRKIDLVDFFEIQTEMTQRSRQMMNASLLFNAWHDQMKKTARNFTPIYFPASQRKMMEDLLVEYESLKSMYQSDGVHMNAKGHKMLADFVWKTLTTETN